jgi:hypothetical protein
MLLRPRATAAAGCRLEAGALLLLRLLRWLLFIRALLMLSTKKVIRRCCCFKRFNRPFYASCSSGLF